MGKTFTTVYYYPREVVSYMILDPMIQVRNIPVYQRNIKLYRGVDNTITVYVQNQDLKSVNITGYQLVFNLIDTDTQSIPFATIANIANANTGVTTITLGQYDLVSLQKTYYNYSMVATNLISLQSLILYSGDNYEVNGTVEIVGDAFPQFQPSQVVTMPGPIIGNTTGNLVTQTSSVISNSQSILTNITQLYYPINYAKLANTQITTTAVPFSVTDATYTMPSANVNAWVISSQVMYDFPTVSPQTTHTAAFYFNTFTGNISVQATLEPSPNSPGTSANSNMSQSWSTVSSLQCNLASNTAAITWTGIYSACRFSVTALSGNISQILYR